LGGFHSQPFGLRRHTLFTDLGNAD
jgi:hypothetical protein